MLRASRVQSFHFSAFREMPRWIVGMYKDECARMRGDGALQRVKIDLPTMIVNKRIPHQADVLKVGEKIKKRIARRWNRNLVSGITQQPEYIRISLARARGQEDVVNIHADATLTVVVLHALARRIETSWLRLVLERSRVLQGPEDCGLVVLKTAFRWI